MAGINETPQQLQRSILACEQLAHQLKFTKTGRALNDALNALGWEMADRAERAMKRTNKRATP
jgi:hypothetical protein